MISDKTTDITSKMSTTVTTVATTARNDFKVADVTVDVTVMEGLTTSNHLVRGTVRRIIPGVCFVVDQGPWSQMSYLWRSLAIVEGAAPAPRAVDQEIVVDGMTLTLPAMRRTDSGADYGFNGYPDCAWWLAQGVQPLFVATPFHYERTSFPVSPLAMAGILDECKEQAASEGGVFLDAWKRQLSDITLMDLASSSSSASSVAILTPPSSPASSAAVCPDAPRKLRLDIPSLADHRGLGILPGDFIKPDPVLTRCETRRYLLDEFERYMSGPIQSRARACFGAHLTLEEIAEEVEEGLWPAARLYRLRQALEEEGKLPEEEVELQFDHVARWVLGVVRGYVSAGVPLTDPLELEAMAFLTVDLLPADSKGKSKTIDSFWNRSPFEALRAAPPLTEEHEAPPRPSATDAEEADAEDTEEPGDTEEADAEEADDEEEDDSDDSDYVPEEDDSMYVSDVEEEEEEEEEDEEEEEEEEGEEEEEQYIPSIDLYRERSLYEILQRELAFKIPTWVPLAGFTAILSYLWIVGFVSGRC
jgi:hypothetical protein